MNLEESARDLSCTFSIPCCAAGGCGPPQRSSLSRPLHWRGFPPLRRIRPRRDRTSLIDSTAPIATRVSELMAQMSLTQKVAMMTGAGGSYVGNIPAISSLCIPAINLEDGPA